MPKKGKNIPSGKAKIVKARSPDFHKLYATNILVEATDVDIRLYTFNEVLDFLDGGRVALSDGVLILHPEATILLCEQLEKLTAKWKKEGKNIKISEKRRETLRQISE